MLGFLETEGVSALAPHRAVFWEAATFKSGTGGVELRCPKSAPVPLSKQQMRYREAGV